MICLPSSLSLSLTERGTILLRFDGSSFLIYRRSAHPARHLLIFLSFFPSDPHGLLVLRREEEWTQVVMMVRLVDAHVELYAEIGPEIVIQFEGGSVKVGYFILLERKLCDRIVLYRKSISCSTFMKTGKDY